MRTVIRWALPIIAAAAVAAGVANAQTSSVSVTWPAACELKVSTLAHWQCADRHLNALDARLRAQGVLLARARTDIAALKSRNLKLAACVTEKPFTRYGSSDNYTIPFDSNGDGNYDSYNWYGQAFSMYDQTHQGDSVDLWVLQDGCSTAAYGRPPAP